MKNAFANKITYFIVTFFFLIITASFLFSGFDNFSMGSAQSVATVDGTPISIREYQNALSRQVDFFNQMMGGKGLTQKQLEEMGIKQSVLSSLIQQKLVLNAADQMGITVSLDEIKNEIKVMPYFQTNKQFDVNLYRNMLQSNGYTPTQFEELVGNDLKQKKIDGMFSSLMLSENALADIARFKRSQVVASGIKISRQSLSPLVSVSEQEITTFLSKPENKKILEDAYSDNTEKYNKPEEVKARHILISGNDQKALDKINALKTKVNVKNFSQLATKETQDPTGKANGGDLGWFSAGRMVPEFEKVAFSLKKGEISAPVKTQFGYHLIYVEDKRAAEIKTLESVKAELARLEIQKTKAQDLDQLLKKTGEDLKALLAKNDLAGVEGLAKKIDGKLFKNAVVNQYDQTLESINLTTTEADQIFKAQAGDILDFGNPGTVYLIKVSEKKTGTPETPETLKTSVASETQLFSRKLREDLIKMMNNKAKIVTNNRLL
jgi:peptidyl-prolyl cis-trans isomerase D